MADKKISALGASTTPLAGTEVLPIVQSSTTVNVSVSNLTAGRSVSAASLSLTTTPLGVASGGTGAATLTSGYVVKGNGTSAVSASVIYDTGTNIGVGTTLVSRLLTVGNGAGAKYATINGGATSAGDGGALLFEPAGTFTHAVGNYSAILGGGYSDTFVLYNKANSPMVLYTNNIERVRIAAAGDVTVNTGNLGVGAAPNATSGRNITISSIESSIALVSTGSKSYSIASGGNYQYTNNALCFIDNTAAATRMLLTTDGELWVANAGDQGAYNLQVGGTGVWGAGAYVNGSDSRLKEEIAPIAPCLDIVNALNPVTFRYKEDYSKDQSVQPGFIAQELLTALEGQNYVDGVVHEGPEYYNVAYQSLIPVLVKAVQELSARVADLEA